MRQKSGNETANTGEELNWCSAGHQNWVVGRPGLKTREICQAHWWEPSWWDMPCPGISRSHWNALHRTCFVVWYRSWMLARITWNTVLPEFWHVNNWTWFQLGRCLVLDVYNQTSRVVFTRTFSFEPYLVPDWSCTGMYIPDNGHHGTNWRT